MAETSEMEKMLLMSELFQVCKSGFIKSRTNKCSKCGGGAVKGQRVERE